VAHREEHAAYREEHAAYREEWAAHRYPCVPSLSLGGQIRDELVGERSSFVEHRS
jgi:hypothetical protein